MLDQAFKEVEEEFVSSLGLSWSSPELTVQLHASRQPYATNGQWEPATQTVRWAKRKIDTPFSTLCFAFWSEPDEKYQTEHFGKVVPDNEYFGKYCLLCRGLSEMEAAEWDRFVEDLKPAEKLAESLENFRFSSGASSEATSYLRTLILKQAEGSESTTPQRKRE